MATVTDVREGFTTVTPYLTVVDIERLVTFVREAFDAEVIHREKGTAGGFHYELRIGDSMVMCGGGGAFRGPDNVAALHVYVPDTDTQYRRALEAGAESLSPPEDKPYFERGAAVKDPAGNTWYIATKHPGTPRLEGMRAVTPFLLASNAVGLIEFLKRAFNAEEIGVYKSPEGKLMHAAVWIGNAMLEFGEAEGLPTVFYLYVPDCDALYEQAVAAGAKSLYHPTDQPYGDRCGGVEDAWGNVWYIATPVERRE